MERFLAFHLNTRQNQLESDREDCQGTFYPSINLIKTYLRVSKEGVTMLRTKLTNICVATALATTTLLSVAIPGWAGAMLNGAMLNGKEAAALTVVSPSGQVRVEGGQLVIEAAIGQ